MFNVVLWEVEQFKRRQKYSKIVVLLLLILRTNVTSGKTRVCVYLTLMFISPRGVISYDPMSLRAMYVKLLM